MSILFKADCQVFIVAPTEHLFRHIWHNCGYAFERMPIRITHRSDCDRLYGLTKFHVIQATSPRVMPFEDWPEYLEAVERTRVRFLLNIGRGPDSGMGNSWIRVVLP